VFLFVVALKHPVGNAFKGPGAITAAGDLAAEANLLKVTGAVPGNEGIAATLKSI
jgi:hypothetical protein